MFAKVFGQIFDSSIAEDYNCRRMFMDLLVLADPTGAVDMTHEAISRRTNVPIDECRKYIEQLCQPDPASRSRLEEGKRLVPLDKNRDWGWRIVNYGHYRKLKDEESRRSYFRDQQRAYRAKKKKGIKEVEEEEGVNIRSTLSFPVKLVSKTNNGSKGVFADRLAGIFGRRSQTPWSEKEVAAFKKLEFDERELSMLERYYRSERHKKENFCRRDLQTLLNNYAAEVDRARAFCDRIEAKADRKEKAERAIMPQREIHEPTEEELERQRKIVREASERFKKEHGPRNCGTN